MDGLLAEYPALLALILFAIGWLLALVASPLVERSLRLFNERIAQQDIVTWQLSERAVQLLARICFWLIIGAAALAALRVLDVGANVLTEWISGLLEFLPKFIVAAVIIGAGYVLAVLIRAVIDRLWARSSERQLVGVVAQWAVLLVALLTGLEQTGLDVSFLAGLVLIAFGTTAAGLALAFAFGARQLIANLVGRRETARYQVGQRIRIGEHSGRIVDLTATSVVLESSDGLVALPNARFATEAVTALDADGSA